jgi:DeoR family transcriptional regulator, suf operon transcriptional repressor
MDSKTQLTLLGPSKARILQLLSHENRTAGAIASNLKMQVSAARKHLDQMVIMGLASESFQKGDIGRPKKIYALTQDGKEAFPRTYEIMLNNLTSKLVSKNGADQTESVMRELARDTSTSIAEHEPGKRGNQKLVQRGLNELGFEATLTRNDGTLTVISRNCPLWKVAQKQGEVVCRGYHAELLKASLHGEDVDRQEWMVYGDSYCRHVVKLNRDE